MVNGQVVANRGYAVDCTADPIVPEGLELVSHEKIGIIHFDLDHTFFRLHHLPEQMGSGKILGYSLCEKIRGLRNVFNANILDYWLANPSHIPKQCANLNTNTLFPGTIFRVISSGALCIRYLFKIKKEGYDSSIQSLGNLFGFDSPIATFDRRSGIPDRRKNRK